ncbi:MAG TPA: PQQ-binding-like beta-propeller repeat protein, partial [Longimicrobium sp.]|nr:PQQ-binding-like beta-propeller repeat protein [Longimicrobium sp.]
MTRLSTRPARLGAPAAAAVVALALSAFSCGDATGAGGDGVSQLWRTPLDDRFATSDERPATDGERVYAIAGGMVTLDADTGGVLWTRALSQTVPRNAVVRGGRVMAAEGIAFALDAATGAELWRFTPEAHGGFGESAVDDHAFYFGTAAHRLHALDQETGRALWTVDLGPDWRHTGVVTGVAVSGDTVYAAAERYDSPNGNLSSGFLFAVDRATGRILWSFRNGTGADERNVSASPAVAGNVLVAGDL